MYTVDIDGLKRILKELPTVMQHKIVGSALFKAVEPIVEQTKANIHSKTGNLVKSIGKERMTIQQGKEIGTVRVGPRVRGGFKGYHGYLVEAGHRAVLGGTLPSSKSLPVGRTRKAKNPARTGMGRIVGKASPTPFLQPAIKAKQGEVDKRVAKELDDSMRRVFRKHAKNNGVRI